MSPHVRKSPRSAPAADRDGSVADVVAPPPPGWQAPAAAARGRAAYRRTDGAEVFFDRRSRPDDPLDSVRPGWNWMARRPEGTMLGHRVAGPTAGEAAEGGLFLPRRFKTALEAMRALDRDVPPAVAAAPGAAALMAALAGLEARGGDLLGPDGALVPRVGLTWEQVRFEAPSCVAVLMPATAGDGKRVPRGALADAREAAARGLVVVPIGEEDARGLRRLAEKLVAAPGARGAQSLREFLDFLVAGATAAPAASKVRKRILLKAA